MQEADSAFRALSDRTRREILRLLSARPHTVGALVERFHLSQPAISRHLAVLRPAGLVLLGPVLLAGLWGLFELLPILDPRLAAPKDPEQTQAEREGALQTALALVLGLGALLHLLLLSLSLGLLHEPARAFAFLMAAFLVLFGNFIGRLRPSWFVGIRTPWTLSSDAVWRRTHHLAARLM